MGVDRIAGQASSETIIILVLVALATVVFVTFYGRRVGTKFSCAGESVANGGGASAGCSGEASGGVASGGVEVDAISGADPRVASSAPGAGTATGGAAQRRPGEPAGRSDLLPVLPTPRDGSGAASGGTTQPAGEPGVAANVPVVPSSGGGSRSASSGAPQGKAGEPADNLSDFLKPGGGPGSGGAPQLAAGQSLANGPVLPSAGGGSGTASGGATQQGARRPVVVNIPPPVFQGDGGPGTAPRTAPLQTFGEVVLGRPDPLALPGSGAGGGASRQQVTEFVLGGPPLQRLNDAAGDLRKVPGGEATVNGIIDHGTIIEVKGANGPSKFFRVDNPFKEFRDETFGRVPEIGVVRDRSKVIVEEASAKSAADPKTPRIVVNDQQTTGEIALELSRQAGQIRLKQGEEARLDSAVRAVEALRPKARADFVNDAIDRRAGAAFDDIQTKKELQRRGASISTSLAFEAEHQDAFNKAFAAELAKSGDPKAALAAATQAARRAVEDVVRKDKALADRAGKAFDERFNQFAKEHPDQIIKAERQAKEDERQAKIEAGRKALAQLVNAVDPNSPQADQVIKLVHAFTVLHPGQTHFLTDETRKGLVRLLGPYGFKTINEVGSFRNEQARLDYALSNFAALNERQRERLRTGRAQPSDFGINVFITYEEMQAREEQKIPYNMGDGTSIMMPRREAREAEERAIINHALEQIQSIKNAGPGALVGRIIGCAREGVAMGPCGEKEAEYGGAVDTALTVFAPVKARANMKASIRNMPSGGHVVRGGPGGAALEPISGPGVRAADRLVPPPPARQPAGNQPGVRIDSRDLSRAPGGTRPIVKIPPNTTQDLQKSPPKAADAVLPVNTGQGTRPGQQTAQGSDTRREVQQVQQVRQQRQQRAADAKAKFDRAIENLAKKGEELTPDRAIEGIERNEFGGFAGSSNSKRHEQAFRDNGGKGKPPTVFPDRIDNQIRIDMSLLTRQQERRLQLAVANKHPPGGPGAGGGGDPPTNTRGQGALDGTQQNTRGQGALDKTQPRPPTQPQSPPKPPDTGKFEAKTGREQQTGRFEKKTGEITRPGAAKDGAAKADTGVPGNFPSKDVVFGLSVGDPKKGPVAKFAGNALNAANPDHLPLSGAATTPDGIATETVAAARTVLTASGGTLRFSLAKFNVDEALTPGSEHFNTTTSIEFRRVLTDPFFRGRVRFYDDKGIDITDSIVKRSVPKLTSR